jgi:hypothetical protein
MEKKTEEIENLMWRNDNSKPAVGIWNEMQNANVVKYSSRSITIQEIETWLKETIIADEERRERMNKEYTPLSKITNKDIEEMVEKWGDVDSMPNNLMAKINVGGSYIEIPVKTVILMHNIAKQEAVKLTKQNGTE